MNIDVKIRDFLTIPMLILFSLVIRANEICVHRYQKRIEMYEINEDFNIFYLYKLVSKMVNIL